MVDDHSMRSVEEALGYTFTDRDLLRESLTHASGAPTREESNERLEFLGDAVLGMVICEHLFRTHPMALEGELTKIKSAVVSRRVCTKVARDLGVTPFLDLGKGMQNGAEIPASLSAALIESLIGAVYMDAGYDRARDFVLEHFAPYAERAARSGHQSNFKSVLQHYVQDTFQATPAYVLLDEKGPDHAKCFEVCVQIGADRYESSWGASKKQAEQQAALNALHGLGLIETADDGEIRLVLRDEAAAGADDDEDE
jgi:ribonuclease-3